MPLKFKTSISQVNEGDEIVRGENLPQLITERNFGDVVYLIIKGQLPSPQESKMINAILISMVDHGPGTNSALAARIVGSSGNQLHSAVAAGIIALGGSRHGGALEGAAKFYQENIENTDLPSLLKNLKEKKVRIPGYGHKILTHDKRSDSLFAVAQETGFYGKHCALAVSVGNELNKISSKPLPLNMDGTNAAILSDMGFPWQIVIGFFIISRSAGLVAQVYEETQSGEGIRRLDEEEIEYL